VVAQNLPKRVRESVYHFKLFESSTALCVQRSPISAAVGPTPDAIPNDKRWLTREEILHVLYSQLVGESFAWSSIQNGILINEVIPMEENAEKPMSSGSTHLFDLHTEDAFHPLRGEYLSLLCLRNPSRAATLISSINDVVLPEDVKSVLFEPRFIVGANVAHHVDGVRQRTPLLFGSRQSPYLCINANVDPELSSDPDALRSYEKLLEQLREHMVEVVLDPGDWFLLDNFKAVHGRVPYRPQYNGLDRWLKRIYITSDLRRSRHLRDSPEGRILKTYARSTYV
jgi:hypothetical protein